MKLFIMAALAPAKDMEVVLHEKKQAAEVAVPDDQLSLAIGRDGGNVRLAAKLTGWKIDIKGKGLPEGAVLPSVSEELPAGEITKDAALKEETKQEAESVQEADKPNEQQDMQVEEAQNSQEVKDSTDTNTSS